MKNWNLVASAAALLAALPMAPITGAALAQTAPTGVLTPAPVPNREPDFAPPADRAGRPDGAERAAPFSGLPNTMQPGAGEPSPSSLGAAERTTAPTPSLSR